MYYPNELASKLAEVLGLPKHLIWYDLKFSYNSEPRICCEFELQENGGPKIRDNKIVSVVKKFKIHTEEIKES